MEKTSCRINDDPWKLPFTIIQKITNYFSDDRKLGCGTFGQVYKGVLEDGEEIAVKVLRVTQEIDGQQFQNEFENLKRLDHENIVRLLGFCDESEETVALYNGKLVRCVEIRRALCLEYMPNRSLAKLLSEEYHGNNWPTRYGIIKGICEGLKHLHEGLEDPIFHLDLKPENILLDQEMVPKIADFGLSRLIGEGNTKMTLSPLGTLGYLPPEFINSGIISKEYDIFSLGVIIMKIIVGLEGYWSVADSTDAPEFIDRMYNNWRSLQEIPNYAFVESYCKQVKSCIEIAVKCMDKDRRKRPSIRDIVSKLDEIELFPSQQQLRGTTTPDVSNIQWMHMQRQTRAEALQSQHDQQEWMVLMQHQFQQNQVQHSHHNIIPGLQSQPIQLQRLLWMLQEHSFQKKILSFANTLIQQDNADPQMQYIQAPEEVSSSNVHDGWPIDSLDEWSKQLENIGGLSLLRYLELGRTNVTQLPQEIMALEHLTTLNLRRTRVRRLPGFGGTKLVSLLADQLMILRGMVVGMQNLEELSKVLLGPDGSNAEDVVRLVNELGRLRMLGVRFSHLYGQNESDRRGVKHFLEEVGKSNLQSLLFDNYLPELLGLLVASSWASRRPHRLRKFELRIRGCLPLVPHEIASLIALTHMHITVEEVDAQGIRALGMLPYLVLLTLYSESSPRFTVSSKDGFQRLKLFRYSCQCGGGMGLQFESGAMPQLRWIWLDFNVQETMSKYGDFDFGIQHLSGLVKVCATIDCKNTLTDSEVEDAEDYIRGQVSMNPNNPVLELNRRNHGQASVVKLQVESVIEIHSLDAWRSMQSDPDKLLVIYFTASWCPASRRMAPVFAGLAKKFANVVFLKVDVDDVGIWNIVEQYNIDGVPSFVFIAGGNVKDTIRGAHEEALVEMLLSCRRWCP
ncbi:unnamed protein product [Urochloa humidicola]